MKQTPGTLAMLAMVKEVNDTEDQILAAINTTIEKKIYINPVSKTTDSSIKSRQYQKLRNLVSKTTDSSIKSRQQLKAQAA